MVNPLHGQRLHTQADCLQKGKVMLKKRFNSLVMGCFFAFSSGIAAAESLWSLYEPGCLASGIDSEPCLCILDEVVKAHGEKAARYVGLEMHMRDSEAAAIRDVIGEDKAFAASSIFDIAQNKHCSAGRLARLKGKYTGSSSGAVAISSSAVAADGQSQSSGSSSGTLNVLKPDIPVVDLRTHPGGAVVDVTATLTDEMKKFLSGTNLRDYVGFYRVTDNKGGIDTNGDDRADVHPGDDDYANQVETHRVANKLYLSKDLGKSQYLGEVHLEGGALYAPYIRFKGKRSSAGLPGGFPFAAENDPKAMMDFFSKGAKKPSNLYFVFAKANPDGAAHLARLGNSQVGFENAPSDGNTNFDDVILDFRFTRN